MATQQSLVPWAGMNRGQTLDSTHSFVSVDCDNIGTLLIFGHIYHSNQLSARLHLYYKLDGGAPINSGVFFQTDAQGSGDFAFWAKGMSAGVHSITIEINLASTELTYYVNAAAINNAATGVPFTNPGAASRGDSLIPWSGMSQGQTLDSAHSFALAQCDDTFTLILNGHLHQTNLPNAQFLVAYRLDGGAPVYTPCYFTTDADGAASFACSIAGIYSGDHSLIVEINYAPISGPTDPGSTRTYYINSLAQTAPFTGIPFVCPPGNDEPLF